jgi:hypothetical protein
MMKLTISVSLCGGVTVLLAACGGGMEAGSANANQPLTAGFMQTSETAAAATADTPSANFDIVGYDSDPLAATPAPLLQQNLALGPNATAYNYYVAPNGSDTAAGTKAAPFKTLARAAKAAKANTTIFVAPGTYAGGIKTTVHGTSGGRIYWLSTTKWGAKIVPPASSATNYAWDNRGNYVDIVGFEINGSAAQAGTRWTLGIYNGGSYDSLRQNHVQQIAKSNPCTSAGGAAILIDHYYYGVQSDIVDNLVHDIGPAGCRFVQGIYVSTSGTVNNNVVYRISAAAIHLWHDATDVKIVNNTVSSSNFGIIIGGGDFYHSAGPADNIAVYNNIVFDNTYGVSEQGKTGTNNTYRNNLVYQNTSYNWSLKNGLTHSATVSSNPLFVSYNKTSGTPNFHLTSSSPAIGRGTSTLAPPTDFDGRPRNASTGYDIGAYQH